MTPEEESVIRAAVNWNELFNAPPPQSARTCLLYKQAVETLSDAVMSMQQALKTAETGQG